MIVSGWLTQQHSRDSESEFNQRGYVYNCISLNSPYHHLTVGSSNDGQEEREGKRKKRSEEGEGE